jgi:hypothetical protein
MTTNEQKYLPNTFSKDRTLKLKAMEGKKPETTSGTIDHRLFKNENNIHAIRQETGLWTLRIEHGTLPPSLAHVQYTNFNLLKLAVEQYYNKRNIEIVEVIDNITDA